MLDNYVGFPDGSVQLKNSIVIPVNNIDTDQIKNGAITTGKINNGAVSHDKIANNAVETNNIKDGAITADKIAEGVIPEDSMHNYSTTEQVIGTWENTDGTVQPLYEKTISHIFTSDEQFNPVSNSYVYNFSDLPNADIAFIYGAARSDNISAWRNDINDSSYSLGLFLVNTQELVATIGNSLKAATLGTVTYFITIRYTKTTDTPVTSE